MKKQSFWIVDVFAEEKYAGNQLAVFTSAHNLSDVEMQQIAKEMNYSETTFILSEVMRDGGYDVRIFTPEEEVPFAGHPTLGTAFIIGKEIIKDKVDKIVLNLGIGQIPVKFYYKEKDTEVLWMKQKNPIFGRILDSDTISEVLNLKSEDIDEKFPVQEVSTGLSFIIIPLKTLDAVKNAEIVQEKYYQVIKDIEAKAILVFCPETYNMDKDLNVRVFAPQYGIPEDPATGSANGCLAGYLVKYKYFGDNKIDIRVEQGYEIGRPSLLFLKAKKVEGEIEVFVGGKVVMVARGELI